MQQHFSHNYLLKYEILRGNGMWSFPVFWNNWLYPITIQFLALLVKQRKKEKDMIKYG